MRRAPLAIIILALPLAACVASAVKTVVTAPFKVGSAVVDATTTSQPEADRNRGRAARKAEEREAKARKQEERDARRRE